MENKWEDVTDCFSEKREHYNGKYLLEDHVLNEKYEVQLWKVIETERLDYNYEIFVNMPKFYASCYPDVKPYEVFNEIKKEIEGRLKLKNPFPWPYIEKFIKKYNMGIAMDSFFGDFDKLLEAFPKCPF